MSTWSKRAPVKVLLDTCVLTELLTPRKSLHILDRHERAFRIEREDLVHDLGIPIPYLGAVLISDRSVAVVRPHNITPFNRLAK
jgi:hypothetical protein